jgi:putative transposase
LIKSQFGAVLSNFFRQLHGGTSFEFNARDKKRGRQVWHNFWDICIRTEADYWTRLNYIHHNPIKHNYVSQMEDWPFSNYRDYLEKKGEEWLMDSFRLYPIVDFTDRTDDF